MVIQVRLAVTQLQKWILQNNFASEVFLTILAKSDSTKFIQVIGTCVQCILSIGFKLQVTNEIIDSTINNTDGYWYLLSCSFYFEYYGYTSIFNILKKLAPYLINS